MRDGRAWHACPYCVAPQHAGCEASGPAVRSKKGERDETQPVTFAGSQARVGTSTLRRSMVSRQWEGDEAGWLCRQAMQRSAANATYSRYAHAMYGVWLVCMDGCTVHSEAQAATGKVLVLPGQSAEYHTI